MFLRIGHGITWNYARLVGVVSSPISALNSANVTPGLRGSGVRLADATPGGAKSTPPAR